ncbi:hypothetical protein [Arthrobacter sp. H5]|uniref:hypothetical protein n=1 Tax=Arthrobacter sp. H5 TaxID=1267973 RepID=UPI0004B59BFB|nr:hypothetical protein [Arthrobacter sp. H5]
MQNQMLNNRTDQYLRPLGAFERTIDLYMHRNPVQLSLTMELNRDVSEEELARALRDLQRLHPLLAADIDRTDHGHLPAGAVFRHSANAIPVRLARNTTWTREAAIEQTDPMKPAPGPLARAVLIPAHNRQAGATIVMTFAHQITDGSDALRAMEDLASLLAGSTPTPSDLPAAQEDLLVNLAPAFTALDKGAAANQSGDLVADAMPPQPGGLRPFDGSLPILQADELDSAATLQLVGRCRAESCTVQAALCAAVASILFEPATRARVRINVPIDLRRAADLEDGVVVRFGAAVIVLDYFAEVGFWELARSAAVQLRAARSLGTVRASALMLAQAAPSTADDAEAAMLAATTADIEITNLGVADVTNASGMRAVWGPTMTTQVAGEQILGVVTHGDVLRMVNLTLSRNSSGTSAANWTRHAGTPIRAHHQRRHRVGEARIRARVR